MKTYKIYITLLVVLFIGQNGEITAQNKQKYIRKGNKEYENKNFSEAEISYRKSIALDSTYYKSQYNLANSLYKQKKYPQAIDYYNKLITNPIPDSNLLSKVLYNKGNSYLQQGIKAIQKGEQTDDITQAIEAYKQALKINPKDKDAKYNLVYAKKLLPKQNQNNQQNQKNQNKDKKQDQNNQQNKDKGQNKEDNQNKNQQDKDNKQQPQKKTMSKDEAERMLEAMKNNEKKTRDKQKVKISGAKIEKDW